MKPIISRQFFLIVSFVLIFLTDISHGFENSSKEEKSALDSNPPIISEVDNVKSIDGEMKKTIVPEEEEKKINFQPHQKNYFILNSVPGDPNAQIKFQISAKFQIFKGSLDYFDNNIFPLYFAYTQKSFWNIGKPSAPFEENNYNPEIFLDYPVSKNRFKLDHIVLSGEHESNGRDGAESRSWNRFYILFSFGIGAEDGAEKQGALRKERYFAYLKLWHAFGEEDQDKYLLSLGKDEKFLDYAGRGEVGFSIRELPIISLCKWLKDNQLDFKTRIFRDWNKGSYEIGYNQKIPLTNFFMYIQYWEGFGESLQRFDKRESKVKAGLSFFY